MKLNLPKKLQTAALKGVFDALKPAETRIVGGVVRNLILNQELGDIDIATSATPEQATILLQDAGYKVIPTGVDHGTITVLRDEEEFEITTLRKDIETDGRHAKVTFTKSFEEDAARRDFTFNALYVDLDGTVTDFYDGVADLKAGMVRFIGEPEERMQEDYLRILRFFRFYADYGKVEPDQNLLDLIAKNAEGIAKLSAERITSELFRILTSKHPAIGWGLMEQSNILGPINLGGGKYIRLPALEEHAKHFPEVTDPVERFASLFGLYASFVADSSPLILSNVQFKQIEGVVEALGSYGPGTKAKSMLFRFGEAVTLSALRILLIDAELDKNEEIRDGLVEKLAEAEISDSPIFPIRGQDVLDRSDFEGPLVGEILKSVEDWWEENEFTDREACLKQLDSMLGK